MIKVTAIVLFIILGAVHILGIGVPAVGFRNLTELPGGFMPHGFAGVWMAVIMGCFSFNGIEVIAVTSGETRDPVKAIPAALRTMLLRLFLFYILALTIVVTFVPWTETGARVVEQSPFVKVFAKSGIAYAAGIMNFVVLSAALSSMNTNVYLCSRMLFSLSRGNYAPRFLGKLSTTHTPISAILVSGGGILVAAGVSMFTPHAYNYLFGVALFGAMTVWIGPGVLGDLLDRRRPLAGADLDRLLRLASAPRAAGDPLASLREEQQITPLHVVVPVLESPDTLPRDAPVSGAPTTGYSTCNTNSNPGCRCDGARVAEPWPLRRCACSPRPRNPRKEQQAAQLSMKSWSPRSGARSPSRTCRSRSPRSASRRCATPT
jgi:hypothetical protein